MQGALTPVSRDKIEQIVNEAVKKWVNTCTAQYDSWTALHLACKDRNEIFMYLVNELQSNV